MNTLAAAIFVLVSTQIYRKLAMGTMANFLQNRLNMMNQRKEIIVDLTVTEIERCKVKLFKDIFWPLFDLWPSFSPRFWQKTYFKHVYDLYWIKTLLFDASHVMFITNIIKINVVKYIWPFLRRPSWIFLAGTCPVSLILILLSLLDRNTLE